MPRRPKYRQLTYSSRSGGLLEPERASTSLVSCLTGYSGITSEDLAATKIQDTVVVYCTCSHIPAETCILTAIPWSTVVTAA